MFRHLGSGRIILGTNLKSWLSHLRTPTDVHNLSQWFVGLRWVVACMQGLAVIPAWMIGLLTFDNIIRYLLVMVTVPLFNALMMRYGPKPTLPGEQARYWVMGGLVFDLLQLSTLLAMTGGWNNPFSSLVFVYAILASLALNFRQRIVFAFILVADILLLGKVFRSEILVEAPWTAIFADTLVEVVVGVSVMVVCSSLIGKILSQERRVSDLIGSRLRVDRLRAIGALSSGVCHQLATPMNNISLRLDRMQRQVADDEDLTASLNSVRQSLNKALAAVARLAEIQVDPEVSQFTSVSFGELVKTVVERWKKLSANNNVTVHCKEFPPVKVSLPVGAITQVIIDLLDNGAEAMSDRSGSLSLELAVDKEFIRFSVRDQGPGFSPQVIERLGEPFNSQKPGGSGLGIYHGKLIGNLLGGGLDIENRSDGAMVTLRISRRPHGNT